MEAPRETFEEMAPSLLRWQLGLGLLVVVLLVLGKAPADVLGGFLAGWLLSLAGLAHIGRRSREAADLEPRARVLLAVRTHLQRVLGSVLGALLAIHLGAHPAAVVGALALLQAAVLCRSMAGLFGRPAPDPGDGADADGDPLSKED